jgi:Ni,Fe-hydrogenase I large subunit
VDCEPVAFDAAKAGNGAGVVETARGPLAYFIEAADGCARSVRSVAPTEWNFHPDGPFMAALAAAPKLSDPLRAAKMLAASFDPCVPLTINVSATERSVAAAEVDCDA